MYKYQNTQYQTQPQMWLHHSIKTSNFLLTDKLGKIYSCHITQIGHILHYPVV